jgi:hypothetical protein
MAQGSSNEVTVSTLKGCSGCAWAGITSESSSVRLNERDRVIEFIKGFLRRVDFMFSFMIMIEFIIDIRTKVDLMDRLLTLAGLTIGLLTRVDFML